MNKNSTVQVSIVVACRNEIQHIREFLDSVLRQDLNGLTWEVIIADGLSNDGTREVLAAYSAQHSRIRVVDNPGRFVSGGLNEAIRASRGDIIVRMDAHTQYAPPYCRLCIETLDKTGADNVGGPARTNATGTYARAVAAAYQSRFCTGARFHDIDYEGWVDTVTYGCWRKSTFERIGLFDENLVRNQDDELNLRLIRAGGKIWQNPRIMSWYSPRASLSGLFRQYFQYGFWKVAVIRKHRIPASWRHVVPLLFVAINLSLLTAIPLAIWAHSQSMALTAATLWTATVGFYAVGNLGASVLAAHSAGWDIFPYLPAVFATYHFAWGFGFLMGLFRMFGAGPVNSVAFAGDSRFTRLSR